LLGIWIASLKIRTRLIEYKSDNSFPPGAKKTLPNA